MEGGGGIMKQYKAVVMANWLTPSVFSLSLSLSLKFPLSFCAFFFLLHDTCMSTTTVLYNIIYFQLQHQFYPIHVTYWRGKLDLFVIALSFVIITQLLVLLLIYIILLDQQNHLTKSTLKLFYFLSVISCCAVVDLR